MAKIKIGNVRTPVEYLKQFFAPEGYGLGTVGGESKWNGDADTLTSQGWHRLEAGTTNGVGSSASLRVDGYITTGLTQTAYTRTGFIMQRTCKDGTWDEWEWVNPPMVFNKEYRTTERRNGMPVYRKVVTYKPDATISGSFVVPHGIDNFDALVDAFATINATIPLPLTENNYTTALRSVESSGIHVSNSNPYFDQNYIWYFYLAYTKKD